jgi:hypothetical protein
MKDNDNREQKKIEKTQEFLLCVFKELKTIENLEHIKRMEVKGIEPLSEDLQRENLHACPFRFLFRLV